MSALLDLGLASALRACVVGSARRAFVVRGAAARSLPLGDGGDRASAAAVAGVRGVQLPGGAGPRGADGLVRGGRAPSAGGDRGHAPGERRSPRPDQADRPQRRDSQEGGPQRVRTKRPRVHREVQGTGSRSKGKHRHHQGPVQEGPRNLHAQDGRDTGKTSQGDQEDGGR